MFVLFSCNNIFGQDSDIDSLKCWLNYISSDELKGRQNGTKELNKVQDWIVSKYSNYGLIPFDKLNSFTQSFNYRTYQDSNVLKNIIGYYPGITKDTFIILSAHIDHIGMDKYNKNDSVYNGADDDGSGVVTLLGIAKKIHEQKRKFNYSIVFVIYSGEEIGLVGSEYFCKSKILPFDKVKLNMNFELVGRSLQFGKYKYYITGPSNSDLIDCLNQYNKGQHWKIQDIGYEAEYLYKMADNYSIVRYVNDSVIHVPAHTFATSTGEGYIHQTNDEIKYIDFDNLASFVNYSTDLIYYISNNNIRINYKLKK